MPPESILCALRHVWLALKPLDARAGPSCRKGLERLPDVVGAQSSARQAGPTMEAPYE